MSAGARPDESTILTRLLGDAGPELTCEECFEHLDYYVELEQGGADADAAVPGMGAHLVGCPACGEDHQSLRALVEAELADPDAPHGS